MTDGETRRDGSDLSFKLAASGKVSEAFAQYVSADFRHHNPYFPGDAKSLKAGMMEAHQKFPQHYA